MARQGANTLTGNHVMSTLLLRLLSSHRLSIFVFHKVPMEEDGTTGEFDLPAFEAFLDETMGQFNVLSVVDAVSAMQGGRLPKRTACITFDDGYPDWGRSVVPTLIRRNLPATFFITTGQLFGEPLWHERINACFQEMSQQPNAIRKAAKLIGLNDDIEDQRIVASRFELECKYATLADRRHLLEMLDDIAGTEHQSVPQMSATEVRSLHSAGFEIGAHTVHHPILTLCTPNEASLEMNTSKETLEEVIGGAVVGFAYPNGEHGRDFNASHVEAVKAAGFQYAVTTEWGGASLRTSPFQLPRFSPWIDPKRTYSMQAARNLLSQARQYKDR